MPETYRKRASTDLRVLFCFGVSRNFFDADPDGRDKVAEAIKKAFSDLEGRFGVRVLGTMDDDDLVVGPSDGWPWTAYILADCPDIEAVRNVTTILRDWEFGPERLWRYMKIEARVGRPLFFGNS